MRPDNNHLGAFSGDQPDTSRRAAIDNYPRSGSQRARLLLEHRRCSAYGLTDFEASQRLGLIRNTVATRRHELETSGWVEPTDVTRVTDMGSEATVYQITAAGRLVCDDLEPVPAPTPGTLSNDDTSPFLIDALIRLGDEYGPRGVILSALGLWPDAVSPPCETHSPAGHRHTIHEPI